MNLMNRMMSYDKNKNVEKEVCDCEECISKTIEIKNYDIFNDFDKKLTSYYLRCKEKEIYTIINLEYWYKDNKTKWFIIRALRKHGNKYDYSKSIYKKYKENVEIICRIKGHKPFSQTPNNHLKGQGCLDCKRERLSSLNKLTKEEFIRRANKVHGEGRYDYSKVEYDGAYSEVLIICHNHDVPYEFKQEVHNHLQGEGCYLCGIKKQADSKKLTLKEFIERANNVHGVGRYDYSKVIYINANTDIIIICHNHDEPYEFTRTPYGHICGSGCPLCKSRESSGERKVRLFLTAHNIEFEKEKRFDDCKDVLSLPFDFYLPQYNICIEFDGRQHFNPHAFNSRKVSDEVKLKNLEYIQNHDKIKTEYCEKNGITLLRFNNIKTVEKELSEYFQKI